MSETTWQRVEPLLEDWRQRLRPVKRAHYQAASYYTFLHFAIGLPAVVATTVVGTTAFASLAKGPSTALLVTTGALSILAAVLSALQTFLRLSERSERHRTVAIGYSSALREIETLLTLPAEDRGEAKAVLDEIKGRLDALTAAAPDLPTRIWVRYGGQRGESDDHSPLRRPAGSQQG